MTFQPVPDVAEFRFTYTYDSGIHADENIVYIGRTDGFTQEQLLSGCEAANGNFGTLLDYAMPTAAQLISVSARGLWEEFGPQAESTDEVVGTGDDPYLPPNCAALVTFKPGSGGPPRQGGIYWPFVRETDCSQLGTLSGDALTLDDAWESLLELICGNVGSPAADHVVVSRNSKTAWLAAHPGATPAEIAAARPWRRDPEAVSAVVSAYDVRGQVASQRRRRGRA